MDLTGWTYVDNDAVLAEVTGHPLSEAATVLGWDGLHDAEVTCLRVILDRPGPFVAGAAASVVERVDGRALLREAYVVYLRATVETLVQRVGSGAGRPWLDGDPAEFFRQQYEQRGAWFESVADLVVDVDSGDVRALAQRIVTATSAEPATQRLDLGGLVEGAEVVGVDDAVGVALLGEEALPVRGEVRVDGVAGDDGVEAGGTSVGLGPEHPAEALGLLLARPERAGHLDRHRRLGQVHREVGDLAHDQGPQLARAERVEQPLALADGRLALEHRRLEVLAELVELVEVLPDDEDLLAPVPLDEVLDDVALGPRGRAEAVALLGLGGGVGQPLVVGQGDADLDAVGRARSSPAPRCPSTGRR